MPDGAARYSPHYDGLSQRSPPSNMVAEQALLGALLANNAAYERVSSFLLPEHFADQVNGRVYKAISKRIEAGRHVTAVTLKSEFENAGILDEVGGTAYFATLLSAMVGIINASEYGREIYDCWLRRQLIQVGENTVNEAYAGELDPDRQVEVAEQALFSITSGRAVDNASVSIADAVKSAIEEGEKARRGEGEVGLSTGFPSLDRRIIGLRPGHLLIIAGRPGLGKSMLAKNIAVNVACSGTTVDGVLTDGTPVAYFSLEETNEDFGASVVSRFSGIPVQDVLAGSWDIATKSGAILKAQQSAANARLEIFDRPRQSLRQIASNARRVRRKYGRLGLVVVDYLQLMPDPPGVKEKRLAVGQNCYGLKDLAKELQCPVLLLSQLARRVEERTDKRPTMGDLRESGEIEDSADAIMLLYREEYYYRQTVAQSSDDDDGLPSSDALAVAKWKEGLDRRAGKAEVIVPKVRRAEAGIVHLRFNGAASRFEEEAR